MAQYRLFTEFSLAESRFCGDYSLYLVSTLAQALMVQLNIGLTVSTLPIIALGIGIGGLWHLYSFCNVG